jgi:hypothetical protein
MKVIQKLREIKRSFVLYCNILIQEKRHKSNLKKLRGKKTIKVAFFAIHSSVWKYDYLYHLMCEHPLFDPVIVVCPAVNYGEENMLREMDKCFNMFVSRGYNVIRTYDKESNEYLDIKKNVNPDVIFYTNPYKGLIDDRYYITNFGDVLTCYAPYSACICSIKSQYEKELHYLVWRFFIENSLSKKLACQNMLNRGRNAQVVGYPLMDYILSDEYKPDNAWKHSQKVKIIWAPHHSFDADCCVHFSSFFDVSDTILELATKYRDCVQIAFKPHPLLYSKLLKVWGEKKTNDYYKEWDQLPNTQCEQNEYIDLFMTSDAMIFDSVSFIHEYLFTRKRSLFLYGDSVREQLNDFGIEALRCHQLATTTDDIYSFVNSLLNEEKDPLDEIKEEYYNKYILPSNAKTASESILNEIINQTRYASSYISRRNG